MRVLLIGGFLGSGKTTLLLRLAKELIRAPSRVAIIENEIGEIGIDGRYISLEGLEVQELYGGCVCCTLKTDLRRSLVKIERTLNPDWVLLEPTGAAYPHDIIETISEYSDNVAFYRVLILIDPVRYEMLLEMMTPLLEAQLDAADIIMINKIDEVNENKLNSVTKSIKSLLKMDKPLIKISAEKQKSMEPLIRRIL
jgi:G3E family GTPase